MKKKKKTCWKDAFNFENKGKLKKTIEHFERMGQKRNLMAEGDLTGGREGEGGRE